jgi:D-arabinan exo alpha-(1,3)/(1,5)-arabinofuranosidase (non-reducing end)
MPMMWIPALLGAAALTQSLPSRVDPGDLTTLKDFSARRASSNNPDPESNDDSWRPIAGETVTLADLAGPGVVTHLWVTVAANEYGWPRLLRLRVYYDGSATPGVDCPLGDFFGVGLGLERPIESLMVRDSSSGRSRNSYWQMPFRKRIRITVTNEGRRRVSNLYFHVDWKKVPALPPGTAYFHARYRQALPTEPGRPYEILSVRGRGHYVGTVFSVVQNEAGWFGEGDERFYADGVTKPDIEGTGTEDYFNDAWSFRVATGFYTGVPVADGTGVGARMSAYRWHVVDPVPFRTSLKLDIEHRGWTYNPDGSVRSAFEERRDLFSSVAFWYQDGIASDQPEVPYGSRRLPIGSARQIEVEDRAADATAEAGTISVQKDVFWSKDLLFFEAKGAGSKVTVPFDVAEDGRYEIVAQLAHSPDYGAYTVELDGQSTANATALEHEPGANAGEAGRIDAYFTETYVAEDHLIGWAQLAKGRHTLTFVCVGRNAAASAYNLGIDTIILAKLGEPATPVAQDFSPAQQTTPTPVAQDFSPVHHATLLRAIGERGSATGAETTTLVSSLTDPVDEIREAAAWSLGQLPSLDATAPLVDALDDQDHVVRGLAALALRQRGTAAASARDALVARLGDLDVGVRMMAAQAIGQLKDPSTIDALVAACKVPDQQVHVLRSLADALGAMGPAASAALPTLRDLTKIPRVEWAAKAAIRRINGQP